MYDNEDISRNHADDEPHTRLATSVTKIDDLHYDCMEGIFDQLDFLALTRLASANKRLNELGNIRFHQVIGTRTIRFRYKSIGSNEPYAINKDQLYLYDLELCMDACSTFGESIQRVCIDYTPFANDRSNWINLMKSVFRLECFEKITSVELFNCPIFLMNSIYKPMKSITTVHIGSCDINAGISDLTQLFPNVEKMVLIENRLATPTILQKHFSELKHLVVGFGLCSSTFRLSNLANMIRLNAQIEKLEVDAAHRLDFIKLVSECLLGLKYLSITTIDHPFTEYRGENVHFENVRECVLPIKFGLADEDFCQIPITFTNLEQLKLIISGLYVNDAIIDFIVSNTSLVRLELATITYGSGMDDEKLSRILLNLPLLEHLTVAQQFIKDKRMLLNVLESRTLKTFCVQSPKDAESKFGGIVVAGWNKMMKEDADVFFTRMG